MPSEVALDSGEQWPDSFPAYYNNDQSDGWFYLTSLQHMEIWLHDTKKLKERKLELNLNHLQT